MSEQPRFEAPSGDALRKAFDSAGAYTVGLEDEVMLLDPETFDLTSRAEEVLARMGDDERFKLELPASQFEIVTPVYEDVGAAAEFLLQARRDLADAVAGSVRFGAAGFHPFSPAVGELNEIPRYQHTLERYGPVAARQLVCALQVHVSIGSADRALAVYNALRSYLPLLAALAANAPFYEGRDSGLASVRPKIGQLLPRQGVPPPIGSWDAYAQMLAWGARAGAFHPGAWWWELRLHRQWGTIEFRVPDGQATIADAAGLAAVAQTLTAWLGDRHDAGERLPIAPSWQIDENRWSACRYGVEGEMAKYDSGQPVVTRGWLEELLATLEPLAGRLGCSAELGHAAEMAQRNGAILQREVASEGGVQAVAQWLAERFLAA